jgi:hypothetical protein
MFEHNKNVWKCFKIKVTGNTIVSPRGGGENMGRLAEFFDQHRDNLEEAVGQALQKADATIESLSRKIEELEGKLRDVAGKEKNTVTPERPTEDQNRSAEEENKTEEQSQDVSVAEQADKKARFPKRNKNQ